MYRRRILCTLHISVDFKNCSVQRAVYRAPLPLPPHCFYLVLGGGGGGERHEVNTVKRPILDILFGENIFFNQNILR
jgi:hypothetical protein